MPAPHPGVHPAPRMREAQWLCAVCNLLNWQSRPRCRECGTPANVVNPAQIRPDSPPRLRRYRQEVPQTLPPWAAAPRPALSAPASRAGPSAEPVPAVKKLQALKEALEALKTADAPADMQGPLREEIMRLEEEARQSQPLGQRLDHARAALRKAETKMEAAATASLAAREKLNRMEEREKRAQELAELEVQLASTGPPPARAEALAAAVAAALAAPTTPYHLAALTAAYARYQTAKQKPATLSRGAQGVRREPHRQRCHRERSRPGRRKRHRRGRWLPQCRPSPCPRRCWPRTRWRRRNLRTSARWRRTRGPARQRRSSPRRSAGRKARAGRERQGRGRARV